MSKQHAMAAMRFGDDEAMMRLIDERSGLLEVKLMALAAICCLHHSVATFFHRERCETIFVLILVFTSDQKL